jgi:aminoglycoside phosphotransferase (APT) family kinase protein
MSEPNASGSSLVSDPGIPTLEKAFDRAVLRECLPAVLSPEYGAIRSVELRVLRQKPGQGRCTFEITLETTSGCHSLIGKVYAEDRADVYHTMEDISRAGFGPGAEFAIPRPLAFLAPLRLLLCEKVAGTRATDLILSPHECDRVLAAERCARWLARFHALGPQSGRVVRLTDQLRLLEGCWHSLADRGRPFAGTASRLFERLSVTARGLGDIELCAGHGMYTSGQVLLHEGRTVTVDWDTYSVTDPSYDVARMLVGFKRLGLRHFGSMHALDGAAEAFLKTYVDSGRSQVRTHLAFQEAAICLERAKRELDKQTRGWRERAEVMLDEGLRVLAQG